jgi:hypothetical protein
MKQINGIAMSQNTLPINNEPVWYKQFWPWFLIILPAIVVVASIATAVIAFRGADTLVADNYYKEGLAINKTVSDIDAAKTANIHGSLVMEKGTLHLTVNADNAITDNTLLLGFSHPLDNLQDQTVQLQKTGNGEYSGKMPALGNGKWYISLQSTQTERPWRVNITAFLPASQIDIHAE